MGDLILGIESSCDETAAAVVESGKRVISSEIHSQVAQHAVYGGVVPEIAGRSHLEKILPVVDAALSSAELELEDLDAIAVTQRPGLIGSLLVGLSTAKGLSFVSGVPLVGVHHIEAHVYAATMPLEAPPWPCLALVVSGGHTMAQSRQARAGQGRPGPAQAGPRHGRPLVRGTNKFALNSYRRDSPSSGQPVPADTPLREVPG